MEILTPETVKKQTADGALAVARRTSIASEQEAKIIRELNILQGTADARKMEIQKETEDFEREYKQRRDTLATEVAVLEQRRGEALKPVEEFILKAQKTNAEADKRLVEIAKVESTFQAQRDAINEELDEIIDAKQAVLEREEAVEIREQNLTVQEERQQKSSDDLAASWVTYHAAVHTFNAEIGPKVQALDAGIKANEIYKQKLDDIAHDQLERERQIDDRRITLDRTVKEVLAKNNISNSSI